ncbi:MAG: zinc ribbon domain-containing protein [Ramlibacter sp.]
MPTYDYACAGCGGFDAIRSIARRDEPAHCPGCGAASPRVLVAAPQLACLAGNVRAVHDTNERAQHAPRSTREGYARLRHPSGCGCCSGAKRTSTIQAHDGSKAFPSRRPWMISH